MRSLFLIGVGLLLSVSSYAEKKDCGDAKNYPEISRQELMTLIEAKSVNVIDVNGVKDFEKKAIPTAWNYKMHRKEFAKKLPSDKSSAIVAYCGGPSCSAWEMAAQKACELGYTNVRHYKGGVKGYFSSVN